MANAKTYNELNQASAVNASDLVAVAQSDKTELQKTTVGDLANVVGELNQAGAMAELSLATSIGKNLLAQRLNEKGVQNITPNNTLIEMADAVDKLQTTEDASLLKNRLILNANITNKDTAGLSPFSFCRLHDDYVAVQAAGKIYVYEKSGYSSIAEALAGATMVADIKNKPSSLAYITSSQDGKTLLTRAFDTDGTIDIYNVDYANKQITYVKSISGFTMYSNNAMLAIKNDRSLIAYIDNYPYVKICSVDDTSKYVAVLANVTGRHTEFAFSEQEDMLYLYTSYGNHSLYRITYTIGDTISATYTYETLSYTNSNDMFYLDKCALLIFKYSGSVDLIDQIGDDYGSSSIQTAVYKQGIFVSSVRLPILVFSGLQNTLSVYSSYYEGSSQYKLLFNFPVLDTITVTGSIYKIKYAYPNLEVVYDASNNTLKNEPMFYIDDYTLDMPLDTAQRVLMYKSSDGNTYGFTSISQTNLDGNAYPGYKIFEVTQTSDDKLLGLKWSVNNKTAHYLRNQFIQADIKSGKFDLTTKQVEIPADN